MVTITFYYHPALTGVFLGLALFIAIKTLIELIP